MEAYLNVRLQCLYTYLRSKDLTNLLEFVITLVIIEINGANFAFILLIHKWHNNISNFFS